MPRRRRSFTPEYRVEAAHLVIDGHRRVAEVARELDVHKNLLHTWVRDERWRMSVARGAAVRWTDSNGAQPLSAQERAELVRLRATVAEQAEEIAFLEEVSAYFAATASKVSRPEFRLPWPTGGKRVCLPPERRHCPPRTGDAGS
ncbi:MAG: transposase [Mycobacterium sp.]